MKHIYYFSIVFTILICYSNSSFDNLKLCNPGRFKSETGSSGESCDRDKKPYKCPNMNYEKWPKGAEPYCGKCVPKKNKNNPGECPDGCIYQINSSQVCYPGYGLASILKNYEYKKYEELLKFTPPKEEVPKILNLTPAPNKNEKSKNKNIINETSTDTSSNGNIIKDTTKENTTKFVPENTAITNINGGPQNNIENLKISQQTENLLKNNAITNINGGPQNNIENLKISQQTENLLKNNAISNIDGGPQNNKENLKISQQRENSIKNNNIQKIKEEPVIKIENQNISETTENLLTNNSISKTNEIYTAKRFINKIVNKIAFIIDTSGSMNQKISESSLDTRFQLIKSQVKDFIEKLPNADYVIISGDDLKVFPDFENVCTYSTDTQALISHIQSLLPIKNKHFNMKNILEKLNLCSDLNQIYIMTDGGMIGQYDTSLIPVNAMVELNLITLGGNENDKVKGYYEEDSRKFLNSISNLNKEFHLNEMAGPSSRLNIRKLRKKLKKLKI
jgi:hypothetical protein